MPIIGTASKASPVWGEGNVIDNGVVPLQGHDTSSIPETWRGINVPCGVLFQDGGDRDQEDVLVMRTTCDDENVRIRGVPQNPVLRSFFKVLFAPALNKQQTRFSVPKGGFHTLNRGRPK